MKASLKRFLPENDRTQRAIALALALILVGCSAWFYYAASANADLVNVDPQRSDQSVYLKYGKDLAESGYHFFVPRHRMPGYPAFVSLFYEQNLDPETLFARVKKANIALSLFLLLCLYLVIRQFLPAVESTLVTLTTALLFYVLKAGYVQPELTATTLTFISAVLLALMLRKPHWTLALAAGATLAAWQWFKPSALAMLALYCGFYAIGCFWRFFRAAPRSGRTTTLLREAGRGGLVPLTFAILIFPHASKSFEIFGDPFFNIITKYHFWCDSLEEAQVVTEMDASKHPIEAPSDELPNARKFFREHTLAEVIARPFRGLDAQIEKAWRYKPFIRMVRFYAIAAIILSLARWRRARDLLKEHALTTAFIAGTLTVYLLVFGWMNPMGLGARAFMSVMLIPLFFLALWTWWLSRDLHVTVRGSEISVRTCVNLVAAIFLFVYAWQNLTENAYRIYCGA